MDKNALNDKFINFEKRIKTDAFRNEKRIGDVGYYIFDYDPQYELFARKRIDEIKTRINNQNYSFKIQEFDIFKIVFKILKEKNYLQKAFHFEKTKGTEFTLNAITKVLKLGGSSNLIVKYVKDNYNEDSIIFLTGIGKIYPIVRAHNILNNLNMDTPIILFYPGTYSGNNLKLFNTINDANYYRALTFGTFEIE